MEIRLAGLVDEATGWVIDFADIGRAFEPHLTELDHHYLNDIEGLENPTCENIARWIWSRLADSLPGLCAVVVAESPDSWCAYHGHRA